ncbi:hypothetical protein C1645_817322 [Glomus cerebriforme]|uniref:Uncharacterized protein n=1 Tax=Glomus cerebriforme TaxID=658196 RepID=A0A397T9L4_9GLOM|nr:hypothetical protein C1645_817322 [Glomus cerebriforme]
MVKCTTRSLEWNSGKNQKLITIGHIDSINVSNQDDDERYLEFEDNQEDNNQDVGNQGEDEGYLGFGNN